MKLNINTSAALAFTKKLETMHKSALPNAVRGTLNKAAFDVKQRTLLKSADKHFVNRSPNFFKAHSRVEMAKGWNISKMQSTIGMTPQGLKGGNNFAVEDLEQQELGGRIKGRAFIPTDIARGDSNSKMVRPGNRIGALKAKGIINPKNVKGSNSRQRFIKSVIHAGKGGLVIGQIKSKQILWRVNSIRKTKEGRFKLTALYSVKKGRSVSVEATGFMRKAALETANKLDRYFYNEASRIFAKYK